MGKNVSGFLTNLVKRNLGAKPVVGRKLGAMVCFCLDGQKNLFAFYAFRKILNLKGKLILSIIATGQKIPVLRPIANQTT